MKIISFFYKVYAYFFHRMPNRLFGRIKLNTFVAHYTLVLMNKILPVYFIFTKNSKKYRLKNERESGNKIIVSLTTFPLRVEKIWVVIETLIRQRVKPDLIVLWLSKEQFSSLSVLPKKLLALQDRGLVINFVEGDIKSYKKYQYVFQEYPDDIIILADDDIMYNSDLVEELTKAHKEEPNVICARYGYKIARDREGNCMSYKEWEKLEHSMSSSDEVFFGSGGGTLIRKYMMHEDLLNIRLARELCPTADDIYLNAMARLKKTKIRFVEGPYTIASVKIKNNNVRLALTNIGENLQNDVQIANVNRHYLEKFGEVVF